MENITKRKTIPVYKPVGISPYDLIKELKEKYPKIKDKKMAYAGKLDPIAEGVVLLVIEEELKRFKKYLNLDKEYEGEILFGFSSDTYDILGMPEKKESDVEIEKVKEALKDLVGDFTFTIPPFSSYEIKKKPLFWWALNNKLEEITLPQKKAKIYSLDIIETRRIEKKELKKEINTKITKVKGDFRQKEIKDKWNDIFKEEDKTDYLLVKIKVSCSSGCYVRSIAHEVGNTLNSGGVLFHLKRNKVGEYDITNSLRLQE